MTTNEICNRLICLAGQMARAEGMPPDEIGDWTLPKTLAKAARREIVLRSREAQSQARRWAIELRDLSDQIARDA